MIVNSIPADEVYIKCLFDFKLIEAFSFALGHLVFGSSISTRILNVRPLTINFTN